MKFSFGLPSRREILICAGVWTLYFIFAGIFIGIRPEHIAIAGTFIVLFLLSSFTRKLAMCLLPFVIFAASYDVMRLYPNYMVNPVDIQGIYDADKALFGVTVAGQHLSMNEFFLQYNNAFGDFLSGLFYLCWVPGPIAFGLYCFFTGKRGLFLRFSWGFLLINFVGFMGYYIHPAAPPWFFAENGASIDPSLYGNTIGSEAGLCRFDDLIGIPLFNGIYSRNANVFAAVPSLHSTYCLCAFLYSLIGRSRWFVSLPLGILSLGICWTAVYTSHHYVIDVLLGVCLCLVVVTLWELFIRKVGPMQRFYRAYEAYVS